MKDTKDLSFKDFKEQYDYILDRSLQLWLPFDEEEETVEKEDYLPAFSN